MSRDPFPGWATLPASQHPYSYVHNNPVNFIDPTGEFIVGTTVLIVAGGVILLAGAVLIYAAVAPNADLSLPEDWYLYPGKWIYDCAVDAFQRPGDDLAKDLFGPNAQPVPAPVPVPVATPDLNPQPEPESTATPTGLPPDLPTPDRNNTIRVRHYRRSIDLVRSSMKIISGESGPFIWVEYPITTPKDEDSIQETTSSFFRPLNGQGGFVEFNVDLNKWQISPDPNLPHLNNSKVISPITLQGEIYVQGTDMYFPLDEPGVNPEFFDWQGNWLD